MTRYQQLIKILEDAGIKDSLKATETANKIVKLYCQSSSRAAELEANYSDHGLPLEELWAEQHEQM